MGQTWGDESGTTQRSESEPVLEDKWSDLALSPHICANHFLALEE